MKEVNEMNHSDPTANRAIGSVNQEWEDKLCLAYRFRSDSKVANQLPEPEKVFTGIYRRLLTDPIKEMEKEVRKIEEKREKKRKRRRP